MSDNFGKVIQVIGPVIDVRFSALQAAKVIRP